VVTPALSAKLIKAAPPCQAPKRCYGKRAVGMLLPSAGKSHHWMPRQARQAVAEGSLVLLQGTRVAPSPKPSGGL
jgi:hypothetical protein